MENCVSMDSPVGWLTLAEEDGAITRLLFEKIDRQGEETSALIEAKYQLNEYFAGKRHTFDLKLRPDGTSFQKAVWRALMEIPYGETRSYADVARTVGAPYAFRAVGRANHCNPIAIFIPCHRVIGTNGDLTGYGGGLAIKEYLLKLENAERKK